MILLWGFIFLLSIAVIFLIWMQFKVQGDEGVQQTGHAQLEQKMLNQEENLKKTLEIMQDLAKKMHMQQEVIDQTAHKLQQVELQNAELVTLIAKMVTPKEQ